MATVYWAIYPSAGPDPTEAEVINQTVPNGVFGVDDGMYFPGSFTGTVIPGLASSTAYKLAAVWSDGTYESNVTSSDAFTTFAAVTALTYTFDSAAQAANDFVFQSDKNTGTWSTTSLQTSHAQESWNIDSNDTPSGGVGPAGPAPGYSNYLYIETSGSPSEGDRYQVIFPATVSLTNATVRCKFLYHCRSAYPIQVSLGMRRVGGSGTWYYEEIINTLNAAPNWTEIVSDPFVRPDGDGDYEFSLAVVLGPGATWEGDPAFSEISLEILETAAPETGDIIQSIAGYGGIAGPGGIAGRSGGIAG